jgi:phenylpropionate dioxygenase-like ring-hydroxylating dioxygenase large terminal subunit
VEWKPVAASEMLPPGAVLGVRVGDVELVVWRTASGEVAAMDARCPHQWTHLGDAGVVDGDELVCTAHCWRFDRDGRGSKVNVRGRRDPKADVEVHPSRERGGMIEVRVVPPPVKDPPRGADGVAG